MKRQNKMSRRQKHRIAVFLAVLVVLLPGIYVYRSIERHSQAEAAVSKVPIPTNSYWGINLETTGHVTGLEAANAGNRKFHVTRKFYTSWGARTSIPSADVAQMASGGRYVHLSIKTAPWAQMASGSHDAEIDDLAVRLRDWNKPVLFTLWHEPDDRDACDFPNEPNTNGCQGSSTDFKNMWKHVHSRFQAKGATNVSFVWVTTAYSFQPASGRTTWVQNMYPGNAVTDWIAADAYNFINDGEPFNYGKHWKSLDQSMAPWYSWAATKGKPLMLGEWGSLEDTGTSGRKAAWFNQARTDLKTKFKAVKAVVYFDRNHTNGGLTRDWRVTTSGSSAAAFYAMGKDSYFGGTSTTPVPPPPPTPPPAPTPPPPTPPPAGGGTTPDDPANLPEDSGSSDPTTDNGSAATSLTGDNGAITSVSRTASSVLDKAPAPIQAVREKIQDVTAPLNGPSWPARIAKTIVIVSATTTTVAATALGGLGLKRRLYLWQLSRRGIHV